MRSFRKIIDDINYFSFLLLVFTLSFNDRILIYALNLWILTSVISVIYCRKKPFFKIDKKSLVPYLFALLFFIGLISMFYTQNIEAGIKILERRLTLLIVVLVIIFRIPEHYNLKVILRAYIFGVFAVTFIVYLLLFYNVVFPGPDKSRFYAETISYFQEVLGIFRHRSYYGQLGVFSVISIYALLKRNDTFKFERICYVFGGLAVSSLIVLTQARVALISLIIIGVLFLAFDAFRNKQKRGLYLVLLGVIILLFVGIINISSRYLYLTDFEISSLSGLAQSELRVQIWHSTYELVESNWLSGLGIGDVQDKLDTQYFQDGFKKGYTNRLNTHNQFLQTLLEGGILSFLVLLSIFVVFIYLAASGKNMAFLGATTTLLLFFWLNQFSIESWV